MSLTRCCFKRRYMEPNVFMELCNSLELCEKLKSLFQEDLDEIAHCITGEVHTAYAAAVQDAIEILDEVRRQITLLRGS